MLKRERERERERMIKSPAFSFSAAIWSYLAYYWPGLNYTCKAKYETLENEKIHYNYFSIITTSNFFKRFVVRISFIPPGCYIYASK